MPYAHDDETVYSQDAPKFTFGEVIAGLSALYVLCIASFNAGYFSRLKGQFLQLFSFADLIGSNIAILQYLTAAIGCYVILSFYFSILPGDVAGDLKRWAIKNWNALDTLEVPYNILAVIALLVIPYVLGSMIESHSFTLALLPIAILQGVFLLSLWTGFQEGTTSFKAFGIWTVIAAANFSYSSGSFWAASEISEPRNQQSLILVSGTCIDRIILRTNSSGFLLYNFALQQTEFRSKDDVRTVFESKSCT
ncbi:hypothetical protein XH83_15465 [Bradyrhizobium sp. CCBAU 53351]|uniref:hypothetical protein n=1 Tax=Bradyrhizobium sp. CCBAU 53351 TaxID=1325114 RepID=UPI001887D103|nr:hypothetical protein [Bradyrhizobium sp. CCBAU 53351]QOZ76728.1 hypothetical protein XH83_15465 [Bradyrhizobium sp. CCBAU 53351]